MDFFALLLEEGEREKELFLVRGRSLLSLATLLRPRLEKKKEGEKAKQEATNNSAYRADSSLVNGSPSTPPRPRLLLFALYVHWVSRKSSINEEKISYFLVFCLKKD